MAARLASLGVVMALALIGAAGFQLTRATPALALGPGRACLFDAPSGGKVAYGFISTGSLGWAYRVGNQNQWVFGATDDPSLTVLPPAIASKDNDTWSQSGDWATALTTFEKGGPYNGVGYYTAVRCTDWPSSNVGAADRAVAAVKQYPVVPSATTSAMFAQGILRAYGINNLGSPDGSIPPGVYFDHLLPTSWEPTQT